MKSAKDTWEKRLQTELSRLRHTLEGQARLERKEAEQARADLQFQVARLQEEIQRLTASREAEQRTRERRARSTCSSRFRNASLLSASSPQSTTRGGGRPRRNCASLEVSPCLIKVKIDCGVSLQVYAHIRAAVKMCFIRVRGLTKRNIRSVER